MFPAVAAHTPRFETELFFKPNELAILEIPFSESRWLTFFGYSDFSVDGIASAA
jgi:hypothetical protein